MSISQEEIDRISAIELIAKRHGMGPWWVDRHRDAGTSVAACRTLVLNDLARRSGSGPINVGGTNPAFLGLTKSEKQKFSWGDAVRSMCVTDHELCSKKAKSGGSVEREYSDEIATRLGKEPRGLFVPLDCMQGDDGNGAYSSFVSQRVLTASGGVSSGGAVVQSTVLASSYIPPNYNVPVVIDAGATHLTGLQGNVLIPKMVSGKSGVWLSPENTAVTAADATFAQVALSPKDFGAVGDISRRLLLQANPAVDGLVRDDIAEAMRLGIDSAALVGTGASGQPTGITGQAGVQVQPGGTNGAALSWTNVTYLPQLVGAANRLVGPVAFVGNSQTFHHALRTQKMPGQPYPVYLAEKDPIKGVAGIGIATGRMMGLPFHVSQQCPSNLTKGSGTSLSQLFFGCWSDLLIGEWGVMDMLVDPYTFSNTGAIRIRCFITIDIAVRYGASFATINDIITT